MKRKTIESNLDLPLECQDPDLFGEFDEEQKLIYEDGGLDLILIENAAELMRRVMMSGVNIEKILAALSERYQNCGVLPSYSFPIYKGHPSDITGTLDQYVKGIKLMKRHIQKLKNHDCIFAVVGLIVDRDGGGHFASFFKQKDENHVTIFDSMSPGQIYSKIFAQLAKDMFLVDNVKIENRFTDKTSLQLTGGFSENDPVSLEIHKIGTKHERAMIRLQCTESQNHFCYMWSIWSIHLKMLELEPFQIAKVIYENRIDPLTVIKRYIWGLFTHPKLRLIDQIPEQYRDFFREHWPVIWTNDPFRDLYPYTTFFKYRLPVETCDDLSKCISLSYSPLIRLNVDDRIAPTEKTEKTIRCFMSKK